MILDMYAKELLWDLTVKIIEECRYNDELAEGYKREILDQEKVYD